MMSYGLGQNEQPVNAYTSPGGEDAKTIRPIMTIRPGDGQGGTISTAQQPPRKEPVDLKQAIAELTTQHASTTPPADNGELDPSGQPFATQRDLSDDDYEQLDSLGEGAGGAVFKVRHKATNRILAKKTIMAREAPMKQVWRELKIMDSTQHNNIVAFYGAYQTPSSSEVNILMDFCEGGSLEAVGKRIKDKGAIVGEKIAGHIAEGVLQGLAYLHTRQLIHRDIKPSNILLSREGVVKLCDFGVSGELVASNAQTFTGTSFYMAPERIQGKEYTIRSDVWSTGISLLELVQNRFPFPANLGPIELMVHITYEPPRLEDEPNVVAWSEKMKDFIKHTLILDPTFRPTPRDMLEHPWIKSVMRYENPLGRWLATVWGWSGEGARVR